MDGDSVVRFRSCIVRLVSGLFIPASLVISLLCCQAAEHQTQFTSIRHKNILILHSYAPDYQWTREVNDGIMSVLTKLHWTNTLRVEYMDSKNVYNEQYLAGLANLLTTKYQEYHFDAVIVSDNNALSFMEKYGRPLFPVALVVATGINGIDSVRKNTIAQSIIIEKADHVETLKHAVKQNPSAEKGYIIVDSSPTGQAILEEVENSISQLKTDISFQIVPPLSFEDLLDYVTGIEPGNFIYLLPYSMDATGRSFGQGYVASFLSRKTALPIYGSWEFQIGTGLVGGRVVSAGKQGEMAANIMMAMLERDEKFPLFSEPVEVFEDLYDFMVVTRLGIPLKRLPDSVEFMNKPESFYDRHRQIIIPALTVIFLLSIFLLLLAQNLMKQRAINRKDKSIIALNKEIIDTQRELVTLLGEVIESHSKETGNHVKRVAKISRFLGRELGLSERELDTLEVASPLHDVGKIGISEVILHKPAQLTEREMEIVRKHTTIGRDILQTSDRQLLSAACSIAFQHHERWDGTGYPRGLKGEEIHIFARITMLADIYDALSFDRSYKKAWSEAKILDYIYNQKGKFFDPRLVEVFMENIDKIRAIRRKYTE